MSLRHLKNCQKSVFKSLSENQHALNFHHIVLQFIQINMISKTNIWYGVGGLFLIVTCVGMYSLIDSEDQDSELLSFLQYDKGSPYSTIRAYKPDDKKKLYLAKLEDSYNSLREQLKRRILNIYYFVASAIRCHV